MKKVVIPTVCAIAVVMFFALCVRSVGVSKVAVVTQFGDIVATESSGLHVKAPWQSYQLIDVSQQQIVDDYVVATKDNQRITQTVTAQIVVSPESTEKLYEKFRGNHIDGIVRPVLSDGFKSATAKYTLEETIDRRDELSDTMLNAVQDRLENYGITVVSVEINNVDLPEEYRQAVEKQKVAERNQITAGVERETARIQAETNEILANSLKEENFRQMMIERWNGVLPLYVGGDSGMGFDLLLG